MIKHVLLWQFKDELSNEEKNQLLMHIKRELEGLVGTIPGLLSMEVIVDKLDSSNADFMIDSTVEDREALSTYAKHPAHVKVAEGLILPNIKSRVCMDYEV